MAGLALLLKGAGRAVSACDLSPGRYAAMLEERGIAVMRGHLPGHIAAETAWVVRSTAVPPSSPEIAAAAARGIPVWQRGEALARFLDGREAVAVAGTHGKTTTTTFAAAILKHAGLRPSWCIGGDSAHFPAPGGLDDPGLAVVEADESDGTLALYRPDIAVLTNVDFDHMEHFAGVAAFEDCFRAFLSRARRRVFYCAHDRRAAALAAGAGCAVPYGIGVRDGVGAHDLAEDAAGFRFALRRDGRRLGNLLLPVRGRHNVLNVLGACGVALEKGVPFDALSEGVGKLVLPRRRFDCVADSRGIKVISDYAHHPAEIAALVRTAVGAGSKRIIAVFQPHRYTRTLALGPDFPAAFAGVDELRLLPVYAASEAPLAGGTSADLAGHFERAGERGLPPAKLLDGLAAAQDWLEAEWREGDLVLIVGAGDIEKLAAWAARELAE